MPRVDRVAEKQREGGLVDGAVACELSGHPTKEVFLQVLTQIQLISHSFKKSWNGFECMTLKLT